MTSTTPSPEECARRCLAGDLEAFGPLYDALSPDVQRVVVGMRLGFDHQHWFELLATAGELTVTTDGQVLPDHVTIDVDLKELPWGRAVKATATYLGWSCEPTGPKALRLTPTPSTRESLIHPPQVLALSDGTKARVSLQALALREGGEDLALIDGQVYRAGDAIAHHPLRLVEVRWHAVVLQETLPGDASHEVEARVR